MILKEVPKDVGDLIAKSNGGNYRTVIEGRSDSIPYKFFQQIDYAKSIEELLSGGIVPWNPTFLKALGKAKPESEQEPADDVYSVFSSTGKYGVGFRFISRDSYKDSVELLSERIGIDKTVLEEVLSNIESHYHRFFIWKDETKTKKRWIDAPDPVLKDIQRRIKDRIIYRQTAASKHAHAFMKGRSIVTNASLHTGKKFVLKMDLKDFFPNTKREMVLGAMLATIDGSDVDLIFPAIELCLLKGCLPQGSPASPALSNVVGSLLDYSLSGLANKHEVVYSRYADDLIFSSDRDIVYKLIPVIQKVIERYGYRLNYKKIKVLKQSCRQKVTGLVVNKEGQVSVARGKRMKFRAFLNNILTGKFDIRKVNYPSIKGLANLINMANPNQGKYFLEKVEEVKRMM